MDQTTENNTIYSAINDMLLNIYMSITTFSIIPNITKRHTRIDNVLNAIQMLTLNKHVMPEYKTFNNTSNNDKLYNIKIEWNKESKKTK